MNLKNSLSFINTVYQNHPLINDSWVGDIYDINGRKNIKYPVASVTATDVTTQAHSIVYTLYLYYADRLTKDRSNTVDVQTIAVNTLREVINYLQNTGEAFEIQSTTITLFEQKFQDECAGAYAVVRAIAQDDIGNCSFSDEKIIEDFKGKTYLLDNYFTKSAVLTLLDDKQDKLIAGENITIEGNVISATSATGGESVWEKDTKNNIFPKGNTNVTGRNCFVTGLTSIADHRNNISIGYNNANKADYSILIGTNTKDYNPSGDALGWVNLIAIGNNPLIPPKSNGESYQTWQTPKLIIGTTSGFSRFNTLAQMMNGDLYIMGINGWNGRNATPDGTSHLQGYLSGLDGRISSNTTAIEGKADKTTLQTFIDGTVVVLADNTIFSGSESISSLTIDGSNFTGDCLIQFTTGSVFQAVTITGVIFEETPVFAKEKYYEINIHNGHALMVEFTA